MASADTAHAFLLKKRELLKKSLIATFVLMIWLTSTNYFAVQLTHALGSITAWQAPQDLKDLENEHNLNQSAKQNQETNTSNLGSEQAIVILGSGRRGGAIEYPQYQHQDIGIGAMERVRYGVTLAKATHLPILLTGGAPDATSSNDLTESDLSQKILQNKFQIQARRIEN